ncbi:hypothetical protein [Micromonospora sp. CPCC 206061]|uniref:hypothetical protein n=1 Tax=Micromonospora sp. CPCC 206061 TaxID=3122410 RepID=UPI002FF1F383
MALASPANNWNSIDSNEVFWWEAVFPWAEADPESLLQWQEAVLAVGDRTGIYRVESIDRMGYRRQRDGYIGDFIREHSDLIPREDLHLPRGFVCDVLDPNMRNPAVACTMLSYADEKGDVAETWVRDMGQLAHMVGHEFGYPYQPLEIAAEGGSESLPGLQRVSVILATSTDIWFPWNSPMGRGGVPRDEPLDNRVLSRLNGARLNAFLGEVREATLAAGGAWTCAPWREERQVNEFGVVLDAPKPARV